MKMIIAITFLGILMHAFGKDCELQPAVANFNFERYFKIPHFYVTHSKNGPKERVCREHEFKKIRTERIETLVLEVYTTKGKEHKTLLDCVELPKSGKPGQFSVNCDVRGTHEKIQLETSIIATDYNKYALLQTCTQSGILITKEDILVLQTSTNQVDETVKPVFRRLKYSLDEWYSRTKFNCDEVKK
uniref:Pc08, similar to pallidipin n=1 Tax=Panstrongylus chinai TaxID=156444 RepID=A0A286T360_9HEMI|nr:Pc08, similar to pallidipin [Panstrongylus chinai]